MRRKTGAAICPPWWRPPLALSITTTTLIAHILRQGGKRVEVGGNLGDAALSLEPLSGDGIYVLELSSYQLELTPTPICDVAILLNVTPDHLSRHGGMDGYIDAKALILRPKGRGSIGVLGVDDQPCRDLFAKLLEQEYAKLQKASNRDVHDVSKRTTLPIAREIAQVYVMDDVKLPWYIDLLNITLGNHDLEEAKRRIRLLSDAFRKDGTRLTENLDF